MPDEAGRGPTCTDGQRNGEETGVDCGHEDDGSCGLCQSGLGCRTNANCRSGLVCDGEALLCGPSTRAAGGYVVVSAVRLMGVSVGQFLSAAADSLEELLQDLPGVLGARILRVEPILAPGSGDQRRGLLRRELQSARHGVELDLSLATNAAAVDDVSTNVLAYVGAGAGSNQSLWSDLEASVPGLEGRIEVDASGTTIE